MVGYFCCYMELKIKVLCNSVSPLNNHVCIVLKYWCDIFDSSVVQHYTTRRIAFWQRTKHSSSVTTIHSLQHIYYPGPHTVWIGDWYKYYHRFPMEAQGKRNDNKNIVSTYIVSSISNIGNHKPIIYCILCNAADSHNKPHRLSLSVRRQEGLSVYLGCISLLLTKWWGNLGNLESNKERPP